MENNYLLDSSAWIEYFRGSDKGEKVKSLIEEESVAISIFGIAEIADKLEHEGKNLNEHLGFIKNAAAILPLTFSSAVLAGKLKNKYRVTKQKFCLGDAIHLATAQEEDCIFITADTDFSGIENVRLL